MIGTRSSTTVLATPDSFVDFRPLPLLRNPHVQTLLGYYLPGPRLGLPARAHVLRLPDGDGLVLHDTVPGGWRPGAPVAVLVHGLSGSHASPQVRRLACKLLRQGLRVVRLDLRGAGKGLPLARACYHAGRSDDLRAALEEVHRWSPASPLLLVGLSLGGNIALKLAGEAAGRPVPGLARVGAMGPPIDLGRCATLLALPRNRLYEAFFVRELVAEARQRQRYFPDLPPLSFQRHMTMRLLDDLYTAPRSGFADALDYYRRASALPLIPRITLPTLILTARDDPFIAVEPFEGLEAPANVTVRVLPHGGHMGFLGWDGAGGIRWAERRLIDWVLQPHRRAGARA
jgi:predicted alpha/beta-fold hydrolase